MRPYATYQLHQIFELSTVPNQAAWWKKFTVRMINIKISMTRRRLTLNLLEKLEKIGIGTNDMEVFSRRYHFGGGRMIREQEKEKQRKQFIKREMKARIQDAKEQLMKVTAKYNRCNRYYRRGNVTRFGCNTKRVGDVMQEEVEYEWQRGVNKLQQKVQHLKGKWGETTDIQEMYKEVAISDKALEDYKLNTEQNWNDQKPPVYGGVNITEEQEAFLRLPPGYTTYERILEKDFEAEIELMATKARWEQMSKRDREGEDWNEEWQDSKMEQEVFDSEHNKLDFSRKKVTDLPTCRRIIEIFAICAATL